MLCPDPTRKSIEGSCSECGLARLQILLNMIEVSKCETVSWKAWKTVNEDYVGKAGVIKIMKQKILVNVKGTFLDYYEEFLSDAKTYPGHLFVAKF